MHRMFAPQSTCYYSDRFRGWIVECTCGFLAEGIKGTAEKSAAQAASELEAFHAAEAHSD